MTTQPDFEHQLDLGVAPDRDPAAADESAKRTWWGQAWIDALGYRARSDADLVRGVSVTLAPGIVRADVTASESEPGQVEIRVGTLSDEQWRAVFGVMAARLDHTAALVDGELDQELADAVKDLGVDLLPRAEEITVRCSCPAWNEWCGHLAVVASRAADELDADPFALLLLRGRSRDQILASVRRLRTASADHDGDHGESSEDSAARPGQRVDEGVTAVGAWDRPPGPLPQPPPVRPEPARTATQSVEPPEGAAFSAAGLGALSADAATRAWRALAEGVPLDLDLPLDEDAVRRVASSEDDNHVETAAKHLGTSSRELARRAAAWELGGRAGLDMLDEGQWQVDPLVMSAARLAVEEAVRGHVRGVIDSNWLTLGDVQLRLSRTGDWWSFERQGDSWEPLGGPAEGADELVERKPARRR